MLERFRLRFTRSQPSPPPNHPQDPDHIGWLGGGEGWIDLSRKCSSPSKKSVQRLKTKVRGLLATGNHEPWPEVRDQLNRMLLGWSGYFCHGARRSAFRGLDHFVYEHARDFLVRRHKLAGRGSRRFSCEVIYGKHRLMCLEGLI